MLPNHRDDNNNQLNYSNINHDDSGTNLISSKLNKEMIFSDNEETKIVFTTEARVMTKASTNKSLYHDISHESFDKQRKNLPTDESDDIPGAVRSSFPKKNISVAPEKNMVEAIDLHVPTQTETPNFNNRTIKVRDFYTKKVKSVSQDEFSNIIKNPIQSSDSDYKRPPTPIESQIMTYNLSDEVAIPKLTNQKIHEEFAEEELSDITGRESDNRTQKVETALPTPIETAFATVDYDNKLKDHHEEKKQPEEAWETIQNEESQNKTIEAEKCCRICLDGEETKESGKLIRPCQCDGSMKLVHEECLKTWIISKGYELDKVKCEVCHTPFVMNFKYGTKFYPKVACEEGLMSFLSCLCLTGMIAGLVMIIVVIVKSWAEDGSTPQDSFSFKLAIVVACSVISGILTVLVIVAMKEAFFILEVREWEITNYDPSKLKKAPKRRRIVVSEAINRAAHEFQENHSIQVENRSNMNNSRAQQANLTFSEDMSRDNSRVALNPNGNNHMNILNELTDDLGHSNHKQLEIDREFSETENNEEQINKQSLKNELKNTQNRGRLKQKITKINLDDYPSPDISADRPQVEVQVQTQTELIKSMNDTHNLFLKDIENISKDLIQDENNPEDSFVKVKVNRKSFSVLKPTKSDPKITPMRSIEP